MGNCPPKRKPYNYDKRRAYSDTLSIPNHKEVARGTLRSLIAKAGLTMDEFLKILK